MPDPLPMNAGKAPTRAYHRAHGNITPEQKARAEKASRRFHERLDAEQTPFSPYKTSAPALNIETDAESCGEDSVGESMQGLTPKKKRDVIIEDTDEEDEEEEEEEDDDDEGKESGSSGDPLA